MPSIEVVHNPLALRARKRLKVRNSKLAEIRLERFLETKDLYNYRLRYVFDHQQDILELGARQEINLITAVRCLREGGFIEKELKWRTNPLLN